MPLEDRLVARSQNRTRGAGATPLHHAHDLRRAESESAGRTEVGLPLIRRSQRILQTFPALRSSDGSQSGGHCYLLPVRHGETANIGAWHAWPPKDRDDK